MATNLTTAVKTGRLYSVGATRLAASAAGDLMALDRLSLPALDHLLAVRIAGFQATATRVKVIALIGVLLGVYLFAGFYLSVRRSQSDDPGWPRPAAGAAAPTRWPSGLDALATGDLTRHIDHRPPPIDRHHARRARRGGRRSRRRSAERVDRLDRLVQRDVARSCAR